MFVRRRSLLIIGLLLLIILFTLSLIVNLREKAEVATSPPSQRQATLPEDTSRPLPKVYFATYEKPTSLPSVPPEVKRYVFKTNYTLDEVKEFGKKFGLSEAKIPDDRLVIMYNMVDTNNRGILTFDRVTGGISFQSYGVHRPKDTSGVAEGLPRGGGTKEAIAQQFLTDLNLWDPTITCPITYERKGLEGVTFVECHRDWGKVGLPILNTVGILNISESQSLTSLALGQAAPDAPLDATVANISILSSPSYSSYPPFHPSTQEGKARPSDFNTITVGVTQDGRILSLESNMRKIVETKQYTANDLLTPEEALQQFINHKSSFSLTIPAGSGSVDWNKVYPGNKADSRKAVITDYLLAYLEKPGQSSQDSLVPVYLIRGTAELDSGYTVRFLEVLPAVRNEQSVLGISAEVAQVPGLKFGTFEPTLYPSTTLPTEVETPGSKVPSPTSSVFFPPQPTSSCDTFGMTIVTLPVIGQIGVVSQVVAGRATGSNHIYYYIPPVSKALDIQTVKNQFFNLAVDQIIISITQGLASENKIGEIQGKSLTDTDLASLAVQARVAESAGGFRLATVGRLLHYMSQGATLDGAVTQLVNENIARNIIVSPTTFTMEARATREFLSRFQTIIRNNELDTWAQKSNIFPQLSLAGFDYVFWGLGSTTSPATKADCPYISGNSPSLYLYPEKDMEVTVSVGGSVSYAYPSFSFYLPYPSWNVLAKPDGRLSESGIRNYESWKRLYYEYNKSKVQFTEPKEGFVVKRDEVESFIQDTLAPRLGLLPNEIEDLVVDVKNALVDLIKDSPCVKDCPLQEYVKISFVEQQELDDKLPVTITPRPDTFHRVHLLLTALAEDTQLLAPPLAKLTRPGLTVLELGASTQ